MTYKEWQLKATENWTKLSDVQKNKYMEATKADIEVYKRELAKWEMKMVRLGHEDVVRREALIEPQAKPRRSSKSRSEQEFGCPYQTTDTSYTILDNKLASSVSSADNENKKVNSTNLVSGTKFNFESKQSLDQSIVSVQNKNTTSKPPKTATDHKLQNVKITEKVSQLVHMDVEIKEKQPEIGKEASQNDKDTGETADIKLISDQKIKQEQDSSKTTVFDKFKNLFKF